MKNMLHSHWQYGHDRLGLPLFIMPKKPASILPAIGRPYARSAMVIACATQQPRPPCVCCTTAADSSQEAPVATNTRTYLLQQQNPRRTLQSSTFLAQWEPCHGQPKPTPQKARHTEPLSCLAVPKWQEAVAAGQHPGRHATKAYALATCPWQCTVRGPRAVAAARQRQGRAGQQLAPKSNP